MSDSPSIRSSVSSNQDEESPPKNEASEGFAYCNLDQYYSSKATNGQLSATRDQEHSKTKQKDGITICTGETAIQTDIKEHSRRRESFLSSKIKSISAHFDRISSGIERTRLQKEQKQQKVKDKLETSEKLRETFIAKRRLSASATIQMITNSSESLNSFGSSIIAPENERFVFTDSVKVKEFVDGQQNITNEIEKLELNLPEIDNDKVKAEEIMEILSKSQFFSDVSGQYKNVDLKSMYKLLLSQKIRYSITIVFDHMRENLSAKYADVKSEERPTSVEARSFLYSLTMLVEDSYHKNAFRVPTYAARLENADPFYVSQSLRERNLIVKSQFLSNEYYDFIVKSVLETSLSLWTLFSKLLDKNHDKEATQKLMDFFYEHFETEFIQQFGVFRYLNLFRSAASLIEVNGKLDSHLEYLKMLKELATGHEIINQYDLTIKECEKSIATNNAHLKELSERYIKKEFRSDILKEEKIMYRKYDSESAKEINGGLTEIRCSTGSSPFGNRDSSSSHHYSGYSSSLSQPSSQSRVQEWGIPLLLIPPTFSLLQWRQSIIKIYIDYRHDAAINEMGKLSTMKFLKTGHQFHRILRFQRHFKSQTAKHPIIRRKQIRRRSGFSNYLANKYVSDVENLREWLSLKTFNEGVMETVEKLSHMPSVNSMLVDVVQIVERCMRALMIVSDDTLQSKIAIVGGPNDAKDRELIALIGNASTALGLIDNSSLKIEKYFTTVLQALSKQVPQFLAEENRELKKLLDNEKIDGTFIQRFIELIRDYMIHGINKFISECLLFVSDRIKTFEVTMFDNTHGSSSVPLDLRLPILFNIFLCIQQQNSETQITTKRKTYYTFFNEIFIHLLCNANLDILELPEPAEAFAIQFEKIHGRIRSFIFSQALLVLLITYFGQETLIKAENIRKELGETQKSLFDFQDLFAKMESFLTDHFEETGIYSIDGFVKLQVIRIIKENCGSRLVGVSKGDKKQLIESNIDTNVILGLIDQSIKVNIDGNKASLTVASVYTKTISNLLQLASNNGKAPNTTGTKEEYSRLIGQFYKTDKMEEFVTNIMVDYYDTFNLFYGIYLESLKSLWMEFGMLTRS
ncbi:DEBR0S2_03268g1_1 [Brettanomyces bruxellensis]|uniref:DEBR0S2_03268g1_1 n=1 Tax=Dekkera bruxellensis TaxID=5007 RepID=A0A7D9H183_DEKBR|nr:DEBR0S2_03268g1_1 [Brettanomyces bruxellensis]